MTNSARIDDDLWKRVLGWYEAQGRHFLPWRHERNPWRIFLAESLLRRTRAAAAAEVFSRLVSEFHGPEDVIQDNSRFAVESESLGLAIRSSLFVKACEILCEPFGGTVPKHGDALINLPGVGHYSRDAILNFGFNEPRYLIDTNTIRLVSRFTGEEIDQTQHRNQRVRSAVGFALGPEAAMTADRNFALLDLAALVCRPRKPKCVECPLNRACNHAKTTYVS
jgi:A/G-specific adenine glycosylase